MKNQLEELRRQHAIRQEDLAQALGVSRQTVISLEKGKYNPSLALAFKLARYFNLSIEDIFDDSDDCPDAASPPMNTPPRIGRQTWMPRRILL